MKKTRQTDNDSGLQFFGKVIASITHDIKNSLATINENAGLLKDHVALAAHSRPLDPERVNAVATRVMDQVKRADGLLKNMNRFAHTVDDALKEVDLNEFLQLLAALSVRFASMRGTSLNVRPSSNPVVVKTSPFELLNSLFLCLEAAMSAAGKGCSIDLRPEKTDTGACVHFGPLQDVAILEQDFCLIPSIDARWVRDVGTGTLTLMISD